MIENNRYRRNQLGNGFLLVSLFLAIFNMGFAADVNDESGWVLAEGLTREDLVAKGLKPITITPEDLDFSFNWRNESFIAIEINQTDSPRRKLYNTTQESNVCKECIDNQFNWCPTSNFASGYCCATAESCPKAGKCSSDYTDPTIQYSLCPNEKGCTFARTLSPSADGRDTLYENLDGKFIVKDLCSFKIANPAMDNNDLMYLRVEYLYNTLAYLMKGNARETITSKYVLKAGQTYTAPKDINFFLVFEALSTSSGNFVFTVWF